MSADAEAFALLLWIINTPTEHETRHFEYKSNSLLFHRCLIKDFELRPNVLDLLQHVFIKQTVNREKVLQKQLIELIDLNQQIGVIEKTRYSTTTVFASIWCNHMSTWS